MSNVLKGGSSPLPPPTPSSTEIQISPIEPGLSAAVYMVHSNYFQKIRDSNFAQKFFYF